MIRGLGIAVRSSRCSRRPRWRPQPCSRSADTTPGPGIPLTLAEERARRISDLRYDLQLRRFRPRRAAPVTGRVTITLRAEGRDRARWRSTSRRRRACAASGRAAATIAPAIVPDHLVVPPADLREGRNEITHRLRRRRRRAQPQRRVPLHAVRAGAGAPGVPLLRSAGPEGALDAGARRARRAGRRSPTAPRPAGASADGRADADVRRDRSRSRPTCSRSPPAGSRSRPPSATAARSACSTARPTRRRSRATATRSSTCTPRRSPGSSTTPASRIPSASSTSC